MLIPENNNNRLICQDVLQCSRVVHGNEAEVRETTYFRGERKFGRENLRARSKRCMNIKGIKVLKCYKYFFSVMIML